MSGQPKTYVGREVQERLDDRSARSSTFGHLQVFRDETSVSVMAAIVAFAAMLLLALIGSYMTGLGNDKGKMAKPQLRVVKVGQVGGGNSVAGFESTDPPKPVTEVHQSSSSMAASGEQVGKLETGAGKRIQVDKPNIGGGSGQVIDVPVKNLPPLGGAGGGVLTGLFDIDDKIKSVVFVIDKSGSMGSGQKLARVKAELIYGVSRLHEGQSFSVIFFDSTAWEFMAARGSAGTASAGKVKLITADTKSKGDLGTWLPRIGPGGGTNPLPPMAMALGAEPELVYLLSDGEFNPGYVDDITNLNRSNATIHCVGLGETVQTLKMIAGKNGGIYYQAR